jgi:hypothetical protein
MRYHTIGGILTAGPILNFEVVLIDNVEDDKNTNESGAKLTVNTYNSLRYVGNDTNILVFVIATLSMSQDGNSKMNVSSDDEDETKKKEKEPIIFDLRINDSVTTMRTMLSITGNKYYACPGTATITSESQRYHNYNSNNRINKTRCSCGCIGNCDL